MKKYELTKETIKFKGKTLYRIKALKAFNEIEIGDLGGYVESEDNLSQEDNCWIYGDAKVFDKAEVYDNAKIYGDAQIFGHGKIYDDAKVYGNVKIYGYAKVSDNARVFGNAKLYDHAQVYNNAKMYGNTEMYDNDSIGGYTVINGKIKINGRNFKSSTNESTSLRSLLSKLNS